MLSRLAHSSSAVTLLASRSSRPSFARLRRGLADADRSVTISPPRPGPTFRQRLTWFMSASSFLIFFRGGKSGRTVNGFVH